MIVVTVIRLVDEISGCIMTMMVMKKKKKALGFRTEETTTCTTTSHLPSQRSKVRSAS